MAENSKIEWAAPDQNATGHQIGAYKSAAKKTGCTLEEWIANRTAGLRWCYRCRAWKAVSLFTIDRSRSAGVSCRCRECTSHATTACRRQISAESVKQFRAQACAICETSLKRRVIDHCHTTGLVRGSLCDRCNQGIGFFLDDPEYLRRAAEYLDKFKQTVGKGDIPADLMIRRFPNRQFPHRP